MTSNKNKNKSKIIIEEEKQNKQENKIVSVLFLAPPSDKTTKLQ